MPASDRSKPNLLHRICRLMARSVSAISSELWLLSGVKQITAGFDPTETCAARGFCSAN